jgi:hypothetical protein
MIKGLDLLAGATYTKEVQAFAKDYAIGLFAETFTEAYKTAEAALKKGCKHLKINLLWSDSHSFGDKDIPKIKKLAKKYNELAKKYPGQNVFLSPFCEHNVSKPDKYLDITQESAPQCLIVNTPWKGGFSNKYINEIHGDHAKPNGSYFYSFDGTECTNSDVSSYLKKYGDAEIFFMWSSRFNLRYREKDSTPRPQRIKEAKARKPTNDYISSIAYLFTDKGTYSIPKGYLIKSHAEKHDANDKKGDKLLIISPVNASKIVLKQGSKVVATLPLYGSFDGGGWRYYWSQMAYKLGSNIDVYVNNKKVGTINPGFRSAPYR